MDSIPYYRHVELKRKDALRGQDARAYRAMCIEAGIRPSDLEDPLLF